jgi:hypothetical protein
MGGGTIMHLVGHQGRLFAADSYWCDSRNIWYGGRDPNIGWAHVLRLDRSGGPWVVDLELGPQHLRPEILKEVTFHTDGTGKPLPKPVTLLLVSTFNVSREDRGLPVRPRRRDGRMDERHGVFGHKEDRSRRPLLRPGDVYAPRQGDGRGPPFPHRTATSSSRPGGKSTAGPTAQCPPIKSSGT